MHGKKRQKLPKYACIQHFTTYGVLASTDGAAEAERSVSQVVGLCPLSLANRGSILLEGSPVVGRRRLVGLLLGRKGLPLRSERRRPGGSGCFAW